MTITQLHPHGPGNFEDPQIVLDRVKALNPIRVIVLFETAENYDHDTNIADGPTALWLLEWAKLKLLKAGSEDLWVKMP